MPIFVRSARGLAVLVAASLALAACSAGAPPSPTPSPTAVATPTPSPKPTPKPTARPTPSPTPSPAPDAAAAIRIGTPYTLVPNPLNPALSGTFTMDMAGIKVVSTLSGREIMLDDQLVGMVSVIVYDGLDVNDEMFEGAANGAAANVAGKVSYTTILKQRVAVVTAPEATAAVVVIEDMIVLVIGLDADDTLPFVTSILKATN